MGVVHRPGDGCAPLDDGPELRQNSTVGNRYDVQNICNPACAPAKKDDKPKTSYFEMGFQFALGATVAVGGSVSVIWIVWNILCSWCRYGRCW